MALTKTDMVDEEMRELAMEDIRDFLKGTFLEGAPIFPVSSVTGEGLDALRAAIVEESRRQPRRRSDLFRLPRGPRVLAQGARHRGHRHAGFRLRRLRRRSGTSAQRPAVRTSAAFRATGKGQEKAEAGHRISLNLHGLSVEDVSRGDVVTHVGTMKNSRRWIVELTCLKSSPRGLRHRGEIHFHHSARELAARLYFYDRDRLEPGDTALVEVHFSEPVAGIFGDRCIVRAFSPLRTVAGGSILYPLDTAPRRSHIDAAMQARLLSLPDADDQTRIGVQLELAGRFGATLADLSILTDLSRKSLEKHLQTMSGKGSALCWDKDAKCWISSLWLDKLLERALAATRAFHEKNPLEHGMAKGVILAGMGAGVPPKLAHFALERLIRSGRLAAEGELLRLPEHKVSLADDQQALKETLLKAHLDSPLMPPNHTELFAELGITARQAQPIFKILVSEGALVKIKEDLYYLSSVMDDLREKVKQFLLEHGEITPGDFRDISGISRKNGIALLEHFDKEQLTMRVGDKRVLRGRSA